MMWALAQTCGVSVLVVDCLDGDAPRDGTAIVVSGYPLGEAALVTTAGVIASRWSVDLSDTLVPDAKGAYEPLGVASRRSWPAGGR
jgi:hypothetical protein